MAKNLKFNAVKFSNNVTKTIDKVEAGINKTLQAPKTLTEQLNKKVGLNVALPAVPQLNQNLRGIVNSTKELAKNPGGVVKNGVSAVASAANNTLKDVSMSLVTDAIGSGINKINGSINNLVTGSNGSIGSVNLKNGVTNAINTNISAAVNNIGGSVAGAVNNTISGTISNVPNALSASAKNIKTSLGGVINNNAHGLVNNVSGSINGAVNAAFSNINGVVTNSVGGIAIGGISGSVGSVSGIIQGGITNISSNSVKIAKAQFGHLTANVTGSLNTLKGTLRSGIRNCLRSSVTGLVRSINLPNIPFGGINLSAEIFKTPDLRAIGTAFINSKIQAGTVAISKKFNKFLSAEIVLQTAIINKKLSFSSNLNLRFSALKNVKNTNYYTAKLTSEVNKSVNKICNTLTPRNKKALAKGGSLMNNVANAASNVIINNIENQIVKSASGFSVKAPTDFFNKSTGKVNATINKATGLVNIAGESVQSTVNNVTTNVQSGVTKTYNNIKDAISSNVAKLKG